DVRCTTLPNGTAWYQTPGAPVSNAVGPVNSTGANAGLASALPYKWVRVTMKENQSVPGYSVDGTAPGSATANTQVCWNGIAEELLAGAATCRQMATPASPVYLFA